MKQRPIVTLSFFRFTAWQDRWWAFRQMGLAPETLATVEGLRFFKMLGSGGGNGFSIRPNFGVYGLLGVWEREDPAQTFFMTHPLFAEFRGRSESCWTVFLRTAAAHGQWDGQQPFPIATDLKADQPVAVLTRATIRTRHLWRFWRFTPPVSRSMNERDGLLFAVGIGELPLVQQATFSIWENVGAMRAYAYGSKLHSEVIRRTRQVGWYEEELFARFHPFASMGTWEQADPLADVHHLLERSDIG